MTEETTTKTTPKRTPKAAASNVPQVYLSLANVLKSLSVAKGGTLPGNMGGKAYITAADASAEVKRQFVENDLVFLPNEEVVKHDNIVSGDRGLKVTIVVTGTYTIVSTVDGSQAIISGTGDGLASGTAVASNIASTNALKNALLRTFLITEQSVEEYSKEGPQDSSGSAPQPRAVSNVKRANNNSDGPSDELKAKIRDWIGTSEDRRGIAKAAQEKASLEGLKGRDLQNSMIAELGI